mmetsp:Transcript_78003/g.253086  ORF Transcript_78003/g.253086 Transcript_78003/m.253086 type:complete len:214 (-) Transcript_78003:50-691(-)
MEHLDAPAERVLIVAVTADDARINPGRWWHELEVVNVACIRIDAPVSGSSDKRLVRRLQEEHTFDFHTALQSFGLLCSAREAVQQAASLLHIRLAEAVLHQTQHHVVRNKAALVQELLGPHAQLSATLHEVAEHIARRKVHEAELLCEHLALRALARSRRTHHDKDPAFAKRPLRSFGPIAGGGDGAISTWHLLDAAGRSESICRHQSGSTRW